MNKVRKKNSSKELLKTGDRNQDRPEDGKEK